MSLSVKELIKELQKILDSNSDVQDYVVCMDCGDYNLLEADCISMSNSQQTLTINS